jgi:hypothetical protein
MPTVSTAAMTVVPEMGMRYLGEGQRPAPRVGDSAWGGAMARSDGSTLSLAC